MRTRRKTTATAFVLLASLALTPLGLSSTAAAAGPTSPKSEQIKRVLLDNFSDEVNAVPRVDKAEVTDTSLVVKDKSGTVLEVPRQSNGKITYRGGALKIAVATREGSDGGSTEVAGGLIYADTDTDTDTIVLPMSARSLEVFSMIRSAAAPRVLKTKLSLSPGQRLAAGPENTAAVLDATGRPTVLIAAPWAVDAAGRSVSLSLKVSGHALRLSVNHNVPGVSYPVLVDPSYYFMDGINAAEGEYCKWVSRWAICSRAQNHANAATYAAQIYFPTSLHNGSGDAFRHCYWNARMTVNDGAAQAKGFGDRHESYAGNPALEKTMDLRNNEIGRYVGGYKGKYNYTYTSVRDQCRNKASVGALWWIVNGRLV